MNRRDFLSRLALVAVAPVLAAVALPKVASEVRWLGFDMAEVGADTSTLSFFHFDTMMKQRTYSAMMIPSYMLVSPQDAVCIERAFDWQANPQNYPALAALLPARPYGRRFDDFYEDDTDDEDDDE